MKKKILNFIKDYIFLRKFLNKLRLVFKILNRQKINFKFLNYGQLSEARSIEMKNLLEDQISKFKKTNRNTFILLEIGSYLGESLELFGDILNKSETQFLIISIDPYKKYTHEDDDSADLHKIKNIIEDIYFYFIQNISLKSWRSNILHFRQNSNEALNLIKKLKISCDFIYIDGSHYYNDIKNDYLNSKAILSIHDNYKGKICGDDYEFSRNELEKIFNDSSNLDKLLKLNKDYIHINKKNLKIGFHPGVTRFFSEIADKIIKTKSGFWYLE